MKDDWAGFPASIFAGVAQSLIGRCILFYAALCIGHYVGAVIVDREGYMVCEFPLILLSAPVSALFMAFEVHSLVGIFYLIAVAGIGSASLFREASIWKTSYLVVVLQTTVICLFFYVHPWGDGHSSHDEVFEGWRMLAAYGVFAALGLVWMFARPRAWGPSSP